MIKTAGLYFNINTDILRFITHNNLVETNIIFTIKLKNNGNLKIITMNKKQRDGSRHFPY